MNTAMLKHLVTFSVGALFAFLIITLNEKVAPESLISNKNTQACAQSQIPADGFEVKKLEHKQSEPKSNGVSADHCKEEVRELRKQVATAEQRQQLIQKTYIEQLTAAATETALLQQRLSKFEPSEIDDKELKEMVLAPFNSSVVGLPQNLKKSIYDFHKREEDLDWGYIKQQQISDFIRAHLNYEFVNLLSVICKVDTCEVAMNEKLDRNTFAASSSSEEEIQAFINLAEPKYKAILDDIRISPEINMEISLHMPGRFDLYMIMNKR